MKLPKNVQEITKEISQMSLDDVHKYASGMADYIVTSDIFGDSKDAWIVRQLLKYIHPEKQEPYISYVINTNSSTKEKWLGTPFDASGAVRIMESIYNIDGWNMLLSAGPYTLNQRIKILKRLMDSESETLWRAHVTKNKDSSWSSPDKWPGVEKLSVDDASILWSAYAYLNNIETLKLLAPRIKFFTFSNEQEYSPNNNYYHIKHSERINYIKARLAADKSLDAEKKLELPEFESSLF